MIPLLLFLMALQQPLGQATPPGDGVFTIEFVHASDAKCAPPKGSTCADPAHWVVKLNGAGEIAAGQAEGMIQTEAAKHPGKGSGKFKVSELKAKFLAESGAPYGAAEKVLAMCAKSGIYQLDVGEKRTAAADAPVASAIGVGAAGAGDAQELLILIGKQESKDRVPFRWIQEDGLKEAIEAAAAGRGNRSELNVVFLPVFGTPWTEVMRIMKSCRSLGFERIDFAAPFTVDDLRKKK